MRIWSKRRCNKKENHLTLSEAMTTESVNIEIKKNEIEVQIEKPEIIIQMNWGSWERGVWITKIVDNLDWTFTRTYWDWATEITTINLKGQDATNLGNQVLPVTTQEQTLFPLANIPLDLTSGMLFVNWLKQKYPEDFVIFSHTLIWLNNHFKLNTTDVVEYIF